MKLHIQIREYVVFADLHFPAVLVAQIRTSLIFEEQLGRRRIEDCRADASSFELNQELNPHPLHFDRDWPPYNSLVVDSYFSFFLLQRAGSGCHHMAQSVGPLQGFTSRRVQFFGRVPPWFSGLTFD